MMRHIRSLLAHRKLLLAAICYSVIITIALLSPTNDIQKVSIENADKVVHFGIHFLMVLLWLCYFYFRNFKQISISLIVKTLITIFIYGIIIELLQIYFDSGRSGELLDVLANSLGLIAGLITFRIFQKKIL